MERDRTGKLDVSLMTDSSCAHTGRSSIRALNIKINESKADPCH